MIRQVKFYDAEKMNVCGGILLDDNTIICGCCGSLLFPDKDYTIIEVYKTWVDVSDEIMGE